MRIFMLIYLLLGTIIAVSQPYTKEQTLADLGFLVESIEKYNPAVFTYNDDFSKNCDEIIKSLRAPQYDKFEHFALVSKIIKQSHEGHFDIGNWKDDVHKGIPDNTYRYFPFTIILAEGKAFVDKDFTDQFVTNRGDEIIAINGVSVDKILSRLADYIPSDGEIATIKRHLIETGFPWMYYLYIEQPEMFELTLRNRKEVGVRKIKVEALNRKSMSMNYEKNYNTLLQGNSQTSIQDLYGFSLSDSLAVLTLRSFYYELAEEFKVNPRVLYKQLFKKLHREKPPILVVDLRDNTGGRLEFSEELLPYIQNAKNKGAYKFSTSWDGKHKKYDLPRKSRFSYKGKIYIIVNGMTYSGGSTCARYFKEYSNAIIIGEETGSRYEGFAAGSKHSIILPESGLEINIPRYHIYFPESKKQKTTNRGLLPDHIIQYTIEDIIGSKDLEMEFIYKDISE